ncbi:MAG TPA: GNAT family N-acetyltransferase [Pyrinomonadaceae bacterium]
MNEQIKFIQAETPSQINEARSLFIEYSERLGIDLCFQSFEKELAELPGRYAPPDGRLLLAISDGQVAGCVALRKIGDQVCEMKRLYVKPEFRGQGIGKAMAVHLIGEARAIGYDAMRLDTLPLQMKEAVKVYRSLGFRDIEPYYDNPVAGALFLELLLR